MPAGTGARAVQGRVEQTRKRTAAPVATTNREIFSVGAVDVEVCFRLPGKQCKLFELFALAVDVYVLPAVPGVVLLNGRICGNLDTAVYRYLYDIAGIVLNSVPVVSLLREVDAECCVVVLCCIQYAVFDTQSSKHFPHVST